MNTRKHTPGPWVADDGAIARQFDNSTIARIVGARSSVEHQANARLIAAAPDLLTACIRAESFMSGFEGDSEQLGIDEDLQVIRTAIAKAAEEAVYRIDNKVMQH